MMRGISFAILLGAFAWRLADGHASPLCSYFASYPPAIGPHTFMLATALRDAVTAAPDTAVVSVSRSVPAQVMRVEEVAGHRADVVREGLRASGGTAVFVRYRIGMSCAPIAASDGAFDSAGVGGLYVGRPRPAERWIGGRPTFDVYQSEHQPLPQRYGARSGHLVITRVDSTPTMTSGELFGMYRTLWADSVTVRDSSVGQRIRQWLMLDPQVARKQPTREVAGGMLRAVTDALIAASPIPLGGTFAITVVVRGVDSLRTFGQTSHRARSWVVDVTRDSLTDVPIGHHARSFAIDVTTASSVGGFAAPNVRTNPCSPVPIVVGPLPVTLDADSSWSGEMSPGGFLECAPQGSALHALTRPGVVSGVAFGTTTVRFRRHADGRVTFEARTLKDGRASIHVRGERVSAKTYGSPNQ